MGYLKAGDTITGREGTAFMTIDGRNVPLFFLKALDASVEFNKTEVPVLGKRMDQNKVTGAKGSGSMTIYKVTSEFAQIAVTYLKTGVLPNIQMKVTNDDPASSIGRQTTLMSGISMDSVTIAKLDVESDALDEDVDFTFDDADILEKFVSPKLG